MSEELKNFFASVFTDEDTSNIPEREQETNVILENVVFTSEKIRAKIKNLKSNLALGPDNISAYLLQIAREELLHPLKIIFQQSFNTGIGATRLETRNSHPKIKKRHKGRSS